MIRPRDIKEGHEYESPNGFQYLVLSIRDRDATYAIVGSKRPAYIGREGEVSVLELSRRLVRRIDASRSLTR